MSIALALSEVGRGLVVAASPARTVNIASVHSLFAYYAAFVGAV